MADAKATMNSIETRRPEYKEVTSGPHKGKIVYVFGDGDILDTIKHERLDVKSSQLKPFPQPYKVRTSRYEAEVGERGDDEHRLEFTPTTPKSKGRIDYDDDIVAVYSPEGEVVFKGLYDDCPYKRESWKPLYGNDGALYFWDLGYKPSSSEFGRFSKERESWWRRTKDFTPPLRTVGRYVMIKLNSNFARQSKVVANALNAVARNGYVKLYAKAGGTATVYEGDKVEYDGKVYTAKALGSPSMDSATLIDDAGNKLVVKMKDYKLKALNFTPTSEFEVGDTVRFKDSVRSVPHDETYKVVKVSGKNITIKGGRDNSTSTEFINNLEIVENTVTRNGRDSAGFLTVGTKVRFPNGDIATVMKVKRIYSHGYVEPEYTVAKPCGLPFIANEGQFEVVNADTSVVTEKAMNAKFKVGDRVFVDPDNKLEGPGGKGTITGVGSYNDYHVVLDEGKERRLVPESILKLINSRACNASSSPFGFFVGEQVVIKKDPSKKKYRVKEITETGDIRLDGATPLFDASELDTANYAGPYRARNSVVANALKARNAKVGDSVWWYDEEDRRVYKGFKIDKILGSGLVEISKKGEGSFTVKRSELALPGGMAITWTNSTVAKALNAARATNARFIGVPPARVKHLAELMEKIDVDDPFQSRDRIEEDINSLGWKWSETRKAWVEALNAAKS